MLSGCCWEDRPDRWYTTTSGNKHDHDQATRGDGLPEVHGALHVRLCRITIVAIDPEQQGERTGNNSVSYDYCTSSKMSQSAGSSMRCVSSCGLG